MNAGACGRAEPRGRYARGDGPGADEGHSVADAADSAIRGLTNQSSRCTRAFPLLCCSAGRVTEAEQLSEAAVGERCTAGGRGAGAVGVGCCESLLGAKQGHLVKRWDDK